MFPMVENQHEESLTSWIALRERVLSWLHGIPSSSSSSSSLLSFTHHSKTRKRHYYSPYPQTRHHEPPRAPSPVLSHPTAIGLEVISTLQSDFPASASEISPIWHVKGDINKVKYHTTSLIEFRVADDLPDPEYNPLITFFATDIEEEYCRLLFLCNRLEHDKVEADFKWKRDMSHAAMRELLDIDLSIQRVLQSAQYVVDYSNQCNLNVDFQALFLWHYHHPSGASLEEPVQYCNESWAYSYSGEPLQNPQHLLGRPWTRDIGI